MNYTKGEWQVVEESQGINQLPRIDIMAIGEQEKNICQLSVRPPEETLANANLIAASVNSCISVNPDNPQAVAESIKDMYEALQTVTEYKDELNYGNPTALTLVLKKVYQALDKAEGGKVK